MEATGGYEGQRLIHIPREKDHAQAGEYFDQRCFHIPLGQTADSLQ